MGNLVERLYEAVRRSIETTQEWCERQTGELRRQAGHIHQYVLDLYDADSTNRARFWGTTPSGGRTLFRASEVVTMPARSGDGHYRSAIAFISKHEDLRHAASYDLQLREVAASGEYLLIPARVGARRRRKRAGRPTNTVTVTGRKAEWADDAVRAGGRATTIAVGGTDPPGRFVIGIRQGDAIYQVHATGKTLADLVRTSIDPTRPILLLASGAAKEGGGAREFAERCHELGISADIYATPARVSIGAFAHIDPEYPLLAIQRTDSDSAVFVKFPGPPPGAQITDPSCRPQP